MMNNSSVEQNSLRAWILAARPKTLTGALIPVMLAGALAYRYDKFDWLLTLLCALFACGMQISANFINDLYDYVKGTDRDDRLGPQRACAEGWISQRMMKNGIYWMISISCVFGLIAVALTWETLHFYGVEFIVIGILCIAFATLYTTRFSYQGLGDVLVILFFGVIPVCGTYYLQTKIIDTDTILLSLISGTAIDALLVINNYRDRIQDAISGKLTLIVIYGDSFGRNLYLFICLEVDILLIILSMRGILSLYSLLITAGVYTFLHIKAYQQMVRIGSGKLLNTVLGTTSRNMFILGVLLSLAIVIS